MNKKEIAYKLKPITYSKIVDDYNKLCNIDLDNVSPISRVGNNVVDFFTFTERLNTKSIKGVSYFELLDTKLKYLSIPSIERLISVVKLRKPYYNEYQLWYDVFKLYFGCINIFKPLNAMHIYKKYKPNMVLDFCMGWGGRLVGASAMGIYYIGIEKNIELREPYNQMVDFLDCDCNLIFDDALNVDYSVLKYDMVLTSPPYYNTEIYSGSEKISKESWNKSFYIPIFDMTYNHLQVGGNYCLNIPNDIYKNVCIPLFGMADDIMPLNKDIRYRNKSINENYKECIYVWHKK